MPDAEAPLAKSSFRKAAVCIYSEGDLDRSKNGQMEYVIRKMIEICLHIWLICKYIVLIWVSLFMFWTFSILLLGLKLYNNKFWDNWRSEWSISKNKVFKITTELNFSHSNLLLNVVKKNTSLILVINISCFLFTIRKVTDSV